MPNENDEANKNTFLSVTFLFRCCLITSQFKSCFKEPIHYLTVNVFTVLHRTADDRAYCSAGVSVSDPGGRCVCWQALYKFKC